MKELDPSGNISSTTRLAALEAISCIQLERLPTLLSEITTNNHSAGENGVIMEHSDIFKAQYDKKSFRSQFCILEHPYTLE